MIFCELSGSVIFEAEDTLDSDNTQDETEQEIIDRSTNSGGSPSSVQQVEPPEFIALRKYYLIQKLLDLRHKLDLFNIVNQSLDLLLTFANELSYDVLLGLSTSIINDLSSDLEQGEKNVERQKV